MGLKRVGPSDWQGFESEGSREPQQECKGVQAGEGVFPKGDRRQEREKGRNEQQSLPCVSHSWCSHSFPLRRILAVPLGKRWHFSGPQCPPLGWGWY